MDSRELVLRTINHKGPERIAFDYYAYGNEYTDIITSYLDREYRCPQKRWQEGQKEYYYDSYGNIWVKSLDKESTRGLPYCGKMQKSWDLLRSFSMPKFSSIINENNQEIRDMFYSYMDRFKVGCFHEFTFSALINLRGFQNLLEDLILEPIKVKSIIEIIDEEFLNVIKGYAELGADGIHIMEDWGDQLNSFISRNMWEEFFSHSYRKVCELSHTNNMKVILHSCGKIDTLIPSFIDCGIDVLQLDQTSIYASHTLDGIDYLGKEYKGQVTFFCPVDIQKTIVLGDKRRIRDEVRKLLTILGNREGGFIAKSYGRRSEFYLKSIGCLSDWNDYAFDCFVHYSEELFGNRIDLNSLQI